MKSKIFTLSLFLSLLSPLFVQGQLSSEAPLDTSIYSKTKEEISKVKLSFKFSFKDNFDLLSYYGNQINSGRVLGKIEVRGAKANLVNWEVDNINMEGLDVTRSGRQLRISGGAVKSFTMSFFTEARD